VLPPEREEAAHRAHRGPAHPHSPSEPIEPLIEDSWKAVACEPGGAGCAATFSDPEYASAGRDTLYPVRAIEEKSLAVNADLLRCGRDGSGKLPRARGGGLGGCASACGERVVARASQVSH
jgi:hypothetical protein